MLSSDDDDDIPLASQPAPSSSTTTAATTSAGKRHQQPSKKMKPKLLAAKRPGKHPIAEDSSSPATGKKTTLLFKCRICNRRIPFSYSDQCQITRHFDVEHGITNVRLSEIRQPDGSVKMNIVKNGPHPIIPAPTAPRVIVPAPVAPPAAPTPSCYPAPTAVGSVAYTPITNNNNNRYQPPTMIMSTSTRLTNANRNIQPAHYGPVYTTPTYPITSATIQQFQHLQQQQQQQQQHYQQQQQQQQKNIAINHTHSLNSLRRNLPPAEPRNNNYVQVTTAPIYQSGATASTSNNSKQAHNYPIPAPTPSSQPRTSSSKFAGNKREQQQRQQNNSDNIDYIFIE